MNLANKNDQDFKADIVGAANEEIARSRNEVKSILESLVATMKDAIKWGHALFDLGLRSV